MRAKEFGVGALAFSLVALSTIDCGLTLNQYAMATSIQGVNASSIELNPIVAAVLEFPAVYWIIKTVGVAIVALALLQKKETILLGIINVMYLTVVLWNIYTIIWEA